MTKQLDFSLYVLQQYHQRGLAGRLGIVNMFIEELVKMTNSEKEESFDKKFGLSYEQKISMLQVGCISHLMMLVEDIAIFCISFMKKESDYYKYLDKEDDEDLGLVIHQFYEKIDKLTNDEVRIILSFAHPDRHNFRDENDKQAYVSSLLKMINFSRYFLTKTAVFRTSHIGVFRRYKHAGFPILLGQKFWEGDDIYSEKFDFASYALTSKKSMIEKLTPLPFSKKTIESYLTYMQDIYLFLRTIIHSKLITLERDVEGVFPYYNDMITKDFPIEEKRVLERIWDEFEKNHPQDVRQIELRTPTYGEFTAWYINLDTYCKSALDMAKN